MKKNVILTFDIEYWYNSKFLEKYLNNKNDFVDDPTKSIIFLLNLLKKYQAKATFFVLGQLAEEHPDLIKKIFEDGHEIASHGYSHKYLDQLNRSDLEMEIKKTNEILKNLIGREIKGFRAPAFSLDKNTTWLFEILEKYNYHYDSSISPRQLADNQRNELLKKTYGIKELPVSIYNWGIFKLPIAGGIYFRLLPYAIFKYFLKKQTEKEMPVLYFHNHELIDCQPKLNNCPFWKKWLKFYGTKNCLKKLEKLLQDFNCLSINQYLNS